MSTSTESLFWARGGEYVKGGASLPAPSLSPEEASLRSADSRGPALSLPKGGCPHMRIFYFMSDVCRTAAGTAALQTNLVPGLRRALRRSRRHRRSLAGCDQGERPRR